MCKNLNSMQLAFLKAIEQKTGKSIKVETPEDVRVLARLHVQTIPSETIIYDEAETADD